MTSAEWTRSFAVNGARIEVAAFVLEKFSQYSGLDFHYVRGQDNLVDDLRFPIATYGDWDLDLVEDFKSRFDQNLVLPSKQAPRTVADWIHELSRQVTEPKS